MGLEAGLLKFLKKPRDAREEIARKITDTAREIIDNVKSRGLMAVKQYSRTLDNYEGELRISGERLRSAENGISSSLKEAMSVSARNASLFHSFQRKIFQDGEIEITPGVLTGIRFEPVKSAAIYVPGGRFPLPSTAVMGVTAAREAGVDRLVALTPPSGEAGPHEAVLGTLSMLGIDEVWAIGGAQAVAAASFGIDGLDAVDLFAGPGNAYVNEAKRLLFGQVGIDSLAGPSEVTIIADGSARNDYVVADLLAQSEHDPMAKATLLCTEMELARSVVDSIDSMTGSLDPSSPAVMSWRENGTVAFCPLEEAIEYVNSGSPEHLVLCVNDPRKVLSMCRSFGSAFLGNFSAQSFGDYVAGTNHILPTGGSARFSGGLWTGTFLRAQTYVEVDRYGASMLSANGAVIAEAEGLLAHRRAMMIRTGVYPD
jgi:histidinol dehydrogenase/sulfopropanediol 3-dehydrogenase